MTNDDEIWDTKHIPVSVSQQSINQFATDTQCEYEYEFEYGPDNLSNANIINLGYFFSLLRLTHWIFMAITIDLQEKTHRHNFDHKKSI